MKTVLIFTCLLLSLNALADNKFESAMTSAIEQLFTSDSPEKVKQVIATFERIAQAEANRWEPAYYTALSYLWLSGMIQGQDQNNMDGLLDEAQKFHDLAAQKSPQDAELLVIQGYIHMMRLTVDPMGRGAELAPKTTMTFQQALAMDLDNPRAMLMLGSMKLGEAQYFNGDTTEACNLIRKADEALDKEKPADKLSPTWGKQLTAIFLQSCQ